jgi:hypothetical protein
MWGQCGSQSSLRLSLSPSHVLPCFPNMRLCSLHLVSFRHPYIAHMKSDFGIFLVLWTQHIIIGHLTNYGQKAYFWTFWTFSHRGKFGNDTKPVSARRWDMRVSADSAGRRESKNRKFQLENIYFSIFRENKYFKMFFLFLEIRNILN